MIFGFNTDVKQGDTVYHVQSEARQNERVLQTQVFVRGRCVGKLASAYSNPVNAVDSAEKQLEHSLRAQHKSVLDAVREGRLDALLGKLEQESAKSHAGLQLQWVNAGSVRYNDGLLVILMVSEGNIPFAGARLSARMHLLK